jgi:hypothetical protein
MSSDGWMFSFLSCMVQLLDRVQTGRCLGQSLSGKKIYMGSKIFPR